MENQVKSFLEEGYDFIEESFSAEPLTYTEVEDYEISEAEAEKSPYKILGKCCGNFQPIGVQSRNSRIYENDHWNVQLLKPEVQERLKSRSMMGTLGHFDRKVTDEDIREGRVSHLVTKLEVHEDKNGKPFLYGELEILDTPAGRILEAMYKGGANLYVSSRGAGKLISVPGDMLKHVDKDSFYFEGFDVVKSPGFLQARPVYEGVSEDKKEVVHESKEEGVSVSKFEPISVSEFEPVTVVTEKQVEELKGQIDKLAKIVEKVVDDVYEEPVEESKEKPEEKVMAEKPAEPEHMQEQPIVPPKKEKTNEALAEFVSLMASTNISEEAFEQIIDTIAKAKGVQE